MRGTSTVLVTGGAGFIGGHTCAELLEHGYEVIVVDDYSNSWPQAFTRVQRVAGRFLGAAYELDLRDHPALSAVFDRHLVDAVVHFAAKRSSGESMYSPVQYYDVNVGGTTALLRVMSEHDVRRLVYASSCALYGETGQAPAAEGTPARPGTPYAHTKWLGERIVADVSRRLPGFFAVTLRCVNTVGAHPSGLLGEDRRSGPVGLMSSLAQVAAGRMERLSVFGDDFATADGTGVRDYIHVMDAAEAHRIALDHLGDEPGMQVFNVGRGVGTSVLELATAFERASGKRIPYQVVRRRPGDVGTVVADCAALARAWSWRPTRDLTAMCQDAWRFQCLNPAGYRGSSP